MDKMFVFKSSTEALSQLFFSHYITVVRETGKNHLIVEEAGRLEDLGLHVSQVPEGRFNLLKEISPRTSLLSLSWASPKTGVIYSIEELAAICRERKILFHLDITMWGKTDLPCDFLTFRGKEATFVLARQNFCPLFYEEIEADTSVIAKAASQFDHLCTEIARLKNRFEKEVGGQVLFQELGRAPHISAISFPGLHHEALLFLLHRKGIHAKLLPEALSFEFSHETTENDIDALIEAVTSSVEKLQMIGAHL